MLCLLLSSFVIKIDFSKVRVRVKTAQVIPVFIDVVGSLLISLLCILYLYVVKYQKYKSVELGGQLLEALTFIARQFCPVEKIFGTILTSSEVDQWP